MTILTERVTSSLKWSSEKQTKPPRDKKPSGISIPPSPPVKRFVRSTEYATADIEASTPQVNPDAVIPTIMGTQRVQSPLVIWYGNYRTKYETTIREETKTQEELYALGGSEFEGARREVIIHQETKVHTPVDYTMAVVEAIALGPHVRLRKILADNEVIWSGNTVDGRNEITGIKGPFRSCIFYSGEFDQAPDNELIEFVGLDELPGYVGMAYIIIPSIASKDYGSVSISYEIERTVFDNPIPGTSSNANATGDINAASLMYEILVNDWSGLGVATSYMDNTFWLALYNACAARNYYFSYIDSDPDYGTAYLETICGLIGAIIYVDYETEKIRVREFHASNYNPSTAITIPADAISELQELERPDWSTIPTHFSVDYSSRKNNYKKESINRLNYSINSDDKRIGHIRVPISAEIAVEDDVAKAVLTRAIMHGGAPVMSFNIVTNTIGEQCEPGTAIKLDYAAADMQDEPFWITKVTNTDPQLNRVVLEGYHYLRHDIDDFDDAPDDTLWEPANFDPVMPELVEVLSEEVPPNLLFKLGVRTEYWWDKDRHYPYAVLLARPGNSNQLAVNVHRNDDRRVLTENMPYAASGFLTEAIDFTDGRVSGYIGDIEIDDARYLQIVDDEGGIGYCGGEWFKFKSVTRLPLGRARLNAVFRGIWSSELVNHAAGATFWMIDDGDRLLGPFKKEQQRRFAVTSIAQNGKGDVATEAFVTEPKLMTDNVNVAHAPVRVNLNGTRVFDGDIHTVYLDHENLLRWGNQYRRSTTVDGIRDNTKTRETLFGAKDVYIAELLYGPTLEFVWDFGRTGDDPGDGVVIDFRFQRLIFKLLATEFIEGPAVLRLRHKIGEAKARWIEIQLDVQPDPGLIVDFEFEYVIGWQRDFTFDYVTAPGWLIP